MPVTFVTVSTNVIYMWFICPGNRIRWTLGTQLDIVVPVYQLFHLMEIKLTLYILRSSKEVHLPVLSAQTH